MAIKIMQGLPCCMLHMVPINALQNMACKATSLMQAGETDSGDQAGSIWAVSGSVQVGTEQLTVGQ